MKLVLLTGAVQQHFQEFQTRASHKRRSRIFQQRDVILYQPPDVPFSNSNSRTSSYQAGVTDVA